MTAVATHRRPGLTLTEVLVAMFVMALGLISLLTLFPLGAIQIGYALRDDRCAQTAIQADAFLRAYWQANVVEAGPMPKESFFWTMDDPNLVMQRRPGAFATNGGTPPTGERLTSQQSATSGISLLVNQYIPPTAYASTSGPIPRQPSTTKPISGNALTAELYEEVLSGADVAQPDVRLGSTWPAYFVVPNAPTTAIPVASRNEQRADVAPSYPVFIDPINYHAKTGGEKVWVGWSSAGGAGSLTVARRTLTSFLNLSSPNEDVLRTFSLLDDLTFAQTGIPESNTSSPSAPIISRQGRYNWSAVVQRPVNGSQDRVTSDRLKADLTILVFDGRPPLLNFSDAEVVATPSPSLTVGSSSISVTVKDPTDPSAPSVVRQGGWLMEGTTGKVLIKQNPAMPVASQVEGVDYIYVRQANWHRIVGLTATPSSTAGFTDYQLDIEPPLRQFRSGFGQYATYADALTTPITYTSTVYFFAGLAEVFARPPLVPNPIPGQ